MSAPTLNTVQLNERWKKVLDHPDYAPIQDSYRKAVTSVLLENQVRQIREDKATLLREDTPTNVTGGIDKFDPVLISLVRRAMPNMMAYDLCGVQPMTGPTGLIFALRSRYSSQSGTEALYNEADTSFSGTGTHASVTDTNGYIGGNPVASFGVGSKRYGSTTPFSSAIGYGKTTAAGEGNITAKMAYDIDKVTVTAGTRSLASEYSMELAQDLKAIHGLDAEAELSNILSTEILAEINREVIRSINGVAKTGCVNGTATKGTFNLDTDSNGRWSEEKFKGLMFQIEREANVIAKDTRRGRGNFILCSSDVASALSLTGKLSYAPALQNNLQVDDTGNTFAGILNGKIRVYIDPYFSTTTGDNYVTVGYKGSVPYDAGLFYCPYVPLQMVRAVDQTSFQPKIAFKTRYGLAENPFVADPSSSASTLTIGRNPWYRLFAVTALL